MRDMRDLLHKGLVYGLLGVSLYYGSILAVGAAKNSQLEQEALSSSQSK